ncbi:MAG TPA: class I SAM-dependent methyltransferase [Sphingomonas sp.]|nr:class I SAM-dependent methyltransferase [Sphingomonas sp.]
MTTASEWSGRVGDAWAQEWRRTDRMFAALAPVLDAAILAAAPAGAVRAIDIGCGAGTTSLALAAARPDIMVTGIDVSPDLVAVALARAADLPNCTFVTADLNRPSPIADPGSVDLLVSRHGVMFFDDPTAAFVRLRAAARPGAALVFSCFREAAANPWASDLVAAVTGNPVAPASGYVPGPFGFADPAIPAAALAAAGWRVAEPVPIDFTYIAGAGDDPVAEAVALFRRIGPIASAMRATPRSGEMVDRLASALERYRTGAAVTFPAAAWLWHATA